MGLRLNTKYLPQEKIFQHRAARERMRLPPPPPTNHSLHLSGHHRISLALMLTPVEMTCF